MDSEMRGLELTTFQIQQFKVNVRSVDWSEHNLKVMQKSFTFWSRRSTSNQTHYTTKPENNLNAEKYRSKKDAQDAWIISDSRE